MPAVQNFRKVHEFSSLIVHQPVLDDLGVVEAMEACDNAPVSPSCPGGQADDLASDDGTLQRAASMRRSQML